jgi:hypothetical protein
MVVNLVEPRHGESLQNYYMRAIEELNRQMKEKLDEFDQLLDKSRKELVELKDTIARVRKMLPTNPVGCT